MEALKIFCGLVGLLAAWIAVGLANAAFLSGNPLPDWMRDIVLLVWVLSWPMANIVFLMWRDRQHEKYSKLAALERRNREKLKTFFLRTRGTLP